MEFNAKYTTNELISADKTGIEAKKTIISNDAYAVGEAIERLMMKIERLRVNLR